MKYVALLRGIGPSNPNMHGAKLKEAAEAAGFKNVQTLLSSGNVIFESDLDDQAAIETKLEKTWPAKLGFNSMTIVRSQAQLQALVDAEPYKGAEHSRSSYLLVTFFKTPPKPLPAKNYYDALGVNALCSNLGDTEDLRTPDFMAKADRQFGKDQITSRTWLTIQRVLAKMK
ncbi:MAG TPA: DUF1697 domain-containing protein [Candidatus Saccharimonadales bacterium]|jgi:hypothetical protein|nr:DUF1697 domain-containing protein [Candidatus Saccharimonadales bacterium]